MSDEKRTATQRYIGTPNGVVLCVDGMESGAVYGRYYHAYREDAVEIRDLSELPFGLEQFFNDIQFPRAATSDRLFHAPWHTLPHREPPQRKLTDQQLLEKTGGEATFIIRVQQRQNSTWQGRLTWVEQDTTMSFRSVIELIHLIESAMKQRRSDLS